MVTKKLHFMYLRLSLLEFIFAFHLVGLLTLAQIINLGMIQPVVADISHFIFLRLSSVGGRLHLKHL